MPLNIPPYGALCNFVVDNKKKPESFLFHGYGWPSTWITVFYICNSSTNVFSYLYLCICFVTWIGEGSGAGPRCGRHADFIGECGGTNERLEIHSPQCPLIGRFYDANYPINYSLFVQLSASHSNALIILIVNQHNEGLISFLCPEYMLSYLELPLLGLYSHVMRARIIIVVRWQKAAILHKP